MDIFRSGIFNVGCACAGWLREGEGVLGGYQQGVYVTLKALFFSSSGIVRQLKTTST